MIIEIALALTHNISLLCILCCRLWIVFQIKTISNKPNLNRHVCLCIVCTHNTNAAQVGLQNRGSYALKIIMITITFLRLFIHSVGIFILVSHHFGSNGVLPLYLTGLASWAPGGGGSPLQQGHLLEGFFNVLSGWPKLIVAYLVLLKLDL